MDNPHANEQPTTLHSLHYKESFNLFGPKDPENSDSDEPTRYYGKYRATVADNFDPLGQGRLLLTIPDVKGLLPSTWAVPCVPFTGTAMGTYVVPPPIGAGVWVEFEQGDPDYPIWVGCFWDNLPAPPGEAGLLAQAAMTTAPATPFMTIEVVGAGIGVTQAPVPMGPSMPGLVTLYATPTSITLSTAGIGMTAPVLNITATTAISIKAPTVAIQATTFSVNGTQFVVT